VDAFSAANAVKPRAYELTPTIYEKILPEQVVILAAHLGLIPTIDAALTGGDVVRVGRRLIDAKNRDEVLQSLASVIELVRASERVRTDNETPDIEHFCNLMKWKDILLFRVLAHTPAEPSARKNFLQSIAKDPAKARSLELSTQEAAWKKFFQRYPDRADTYLGGIDDRTYDKIKLLRELMATVAPEEFGNLMPDD